MRRVPMYGDFLSGIRILRSESRSIRRLTIYNEMGI